MIPVSSGSRTLKDAINEAMRDWVATVETTHYCLGSVMGPHPYPWMVREFQRIVGDEAAVQCPVPSSTAAIPTSSSPASAVAATPPAPSPASSTAAARLVGVEPEGGAAIGRGVPGVVHGSKSFLLQDEHGQVLEAHSISAGLDYPGVGPEHAHLASIGRVRYVAANDAEVLGGVQAAGPDRGHHPRPGVRPRPGVGHPGRRHRRAARRLHGPGHPLRAGATRTSTRSMHLLDLESAE